MSKGKKLIKKAVGRVVQNNDQKKRQQEQERQQQQQQMISDQQQNRARQRDADEGALEVGDADGNELGGLITGVDGDQKKRKISGSNALGG